MKNYTFLKESILRIPFKSIKNSFTIEEIKKFLKEDTLIKEAIYISSPNLVTECEKWINGEILEEDKKNKLIYSVLKYIIRLHSRATPFGLFAACGVVSLSFMENLVIKKDDFYRNTRLDMDLVCSIARNLAMNAIVQENFKYYSNSTLYVLRDNVRYVEYFHDKNGVKRYQISEVYNSYYLQEIVKRASNGVYMSDLIKLLVQNSVSYNDSMSFVKELILNQILVSELEPSVCGKNAFVQILDNMDSKSHINELNEIRERLIDIKNSLEPLDNFSNTSINKYKKLTKEIDDYGFEHDLTRIVQVDLFFQNSQKYEFNSNIFSKLSKGLSILNKLTSFSESNNLKLFKEQFTIRYGDKYVPLFDVLDSEAGIGYGKSLNSNNDSGYLVDDLLIRRKQLNEFELVYTKKQSFLLKKLIEATRNNNYIVSLREDELNVFEENWDDLPDSMSIMYSHVGKRNNNDVFYINSAGGTSGINLISRFSMNNKRILDIANTIAEHEKKINNENVLASILHLPEERIGNILMRPSLRDYEIPFLSKSLKEKKKQISISDLTISIQNNRIILWSKALKKEVIPRLDNAHNFSNSTLPIYHFLCDIQNQNIRNELFFDWGSIQREFSFLPRVEFEDIILSPALWKLNKSEFSLLLSKNEIDLEKWRKRWNVPKLILLVEGDNELLIDLENELSFKMFVTEIEKKSFITIKEFLFNQEQCIVKDENNNAYVNQFVSFLLKDINKLSLNKIDFEPNKNIETLNSFHIGSEWLYFKVYCGIKTSDRILTEILKSFCDSMIRQNLIYKWFFIRYSDPNEHLRIRFHLRDNKYFGEVVDKFNQSISTFTQTGLIWQTQIDSYQREINRYGGNLNITFAEKIFYYDSVCILNVLKNININDNIRWLVGLKLVIDTFKAFNLRDEDILRISNNLTLQMQSEFEITKEYKKNIDAKYRKHREDIEYLVYNGNLNQSKYMIIDLHLQERFINFKIIVDEMKLSELGLTNEYIDSIISSYTHMSLNRLFSNKQRLQEMIIYNYVYKAYKSVIARGSK